MDPITLEIIRNKLIGITEEMGVSLVRTAYSPNIKERKDCSCAIFDRHGRLIAQAEHIPVHLGAMPFAVKTILDKEFKKGDVFILNDPYLGGTHLPDITLVSPVFDKELIGFVVTRAHHSDVGGKTPGSMPSDSTEIYEEGLIIPPVKIISEGKIQRDIVDLILSNVRTKKEREGDIKAQISANSTGEVRLLDVYRRYPDFDQYTEEILRYSETIVRKELKKMQDIKVRSEDYLEWEKLIKIRVEVEKKNDELFIDFSGTDKEISGNLNCVESITLSSVYYMIIGLMQRDLMINEGCYRPIKVKIPKGTILNAKKPKAVVAGNVETSQRIVDVLMGAFSKIVPERVIAQSQGTMNNIIIGGTHKNRNFTYYETIGGGMGASLFNNGESGVHCHMTNTLNTPIESLETEYPLHVLRYSLRDNSGGSGNHKGGSGIIREIQVLTDCIISIISERREIAPKGLFGGQNAEKGVNLLNGKKIPGKCTLKLKKEDIVTIETPGGGGCGQLDTE
ncbi:MAG: hydantoinase B/oxoprolinase family protein [Methanomicrobia archaeon]|nr:hydantoinase B/oxoprolinase family protein [Methanomicrobia archaeon]